MITQKFQMGNSSRQRHFVYYRIGSIWNIIPSIEKKESGVLIKCRECGYKVSSTAKACPSCGCTSPIPYKTRLLVLAIVILTFAWLI